MSSESHAVLAFNRGIISRLGLARLDIPRVRLSAEIMRNWIPRVLGSMMLRPGLEYIGNTASDAVAKLIEFVFSSTDKALYELTPSLLRIWVNDVLVSRPTGITSQTTNGNFTTDLSSWGDNDEAGASSVFVTGGFMGLTGNGTARALRTQTVTPPSAERSILHGVRIVIERGPVTFRIVGGIAGFPQLVFETELQRGTYSFGVIPDLDFGLEFSNINKRQVLVDSCTIEPAGTLTLPTPWSASDLSNIRYAQSGDVIFVAVDGVAQKRIERRSTIKGSDSSIVISSWAVVDYVSDSGPFKLENVTPITLTPGGLSGNTTLTASRRLFTSENAPSTNNAGSLFRVNSNGQRVTQNVTAANQFSGAIRVTGVGSGRIFSVIRTGTWVATVTLQRSLTSNTGPWTDQSPTYTGNGTAVIDDTLDNQIAFYRVGVKTGDFTSGTVELELSYTVGSIRGIARVTGFTSETVVDVEVLTEFGGTDASDDWSEGDWSARRGFPSAVTFHEGRLCWFGKGKFWHSVSDAFDNFDPEVEGDSGPINREIGSGPIDTLKWAISVERLVAGGAGAEWSARSSSLDEPLTRTTFNLKAASTQGSADVDALKIDKRIVFVQRGATRVYELSLRSDPAQVDFGSIDLTQLVPEIGEPSIVRSAVQRQPDTRLHFVRSDGVAAVLINDPTENILAWYEVESDGASGLIEDVAVVPGNSIEDDVYYVVQRRLPTGPTGSNLITNGTFDTDISGWTDKSGAQAGIRFEPTLKALLIFADGPGVGIAEQIIATVSGQTYRITFDTLPVVNGTVRVGAASGGSELLSETLSSFDSFSFTFTATSTTSFLQFFTSSAIFGGTLIVDNVVAVELNTPVRHIVKWAQESEAKGTALNKQADSFIIYTGAATTIITGLTHLEGEQVVVWAAGADVGTLVSISNTWTFVHTVSGGQITLATAATNVCVGLPYKARWKSGKLALAAALGSPLTKRKRIPSIGFILADIHAQGLFFGRDFTKMDNLPLRREGQSVDVGSVIADIDDGNIPFPGEWSTDSRFVLEARSPRPVTIVAVVADVELQEQR